ncbi:monovalent cation/H+ antiporter subunit D family protein [Candidatus Pelagisphaera phototrophica]|uniref:monovalent cation/H+ antiporter subunit D family protein n=1 Tax=Candidatus Pelagisphaera phototrophica TaxID=2684113 RepID=UPI0019F03CDB|nr:monovalent cation/H+ antiporter subunit D family protein [Candidatus Pelagisphaera phototrophica]QXD33453.1 monovalent cation/H+ antiporter subunit D family protein [Candidatus Pelagisphaera phototrophica]
MPSSITSFTPVLASLVSLLAVLPIVLLGKRPNLREGATFLAAFIKFGLVVSMLPTILAGSTIEFTVWEIVPNLAIAFRVDGLGMLFGLVASSLWIVTSLYSIGYMRGLKEHSQTRFFTFFAISLSATIGVAFAANLFTLYLFYEMLSLATYPLVTHHQDKEARTGGRTYLTYLLSTSIGFVLPALIFVYVKTGSSMEFSSSGFLSGHITASEALILLLLFTFGFAKSGLMPFHSWLPGAMVAPTPVSALLHAVAVVKVGVFCILRVFTGVFGTDYLQDLDIATVVAWIAAFTIVASSLIALTQDNLKRRLAFSTVGQLSYIILGAALLSDRAVTGSMTHIAMHAVGKITLFMCAGAIFVATGKKYISQMDGLGRKMPITFAAFSIGALSVIGLPPTGGLISKFYLVTGAMDAGQSALLVIFLISTILNAAYLLPIGYRAFFPKDPQLAKQPFSWKTTEEANWQCITPLSITAVLAIILFIKPQFLLQLAGLMVGANG